MAQRFDLQRTQLLGEPAPLTDGVALGRYGSAFFSIGPRILAQPTDSGGAFQANLVWFDRAGKNLGQLAAPGEYGDPAISPDDRRVTVDRIESGNQDLWTINVADGRPTRFTFDSEIDHGPVRAAGWRDDRLGLAPKRRRRSLPPAVRRQWIR